MTKDVETYLSDGCMRCKFGGTPQCKVNTWRSELVRLRAIVLDCGLTEESKWGVPCYTYKNSNILIVSAFKEYASLSFFKGVLLQDEKELLHSSGENSQSARYFKFTSSKQIVDLEESIKAYIFEAVEVEKAGLKVDFKQKDELIYPEELLQKFKENTKLETAFEALTPGRKRGYILHFTQPKQSKTRVSRIEKCSDKIMSGLGYFD
ncbi:MAG: YdeI/OmpD-associated family protein [Cyclobacteriaceae bacterium]|nr:YdeI/OmpD-associated family protein [Cyclobacteriaceae bacterium]